MFSVVKQTSNVYYFLISKAHFFSAWSTYPEAVLVFKKVSHVFVIGFVFFCFLFFSYAVTSSSIVYLTVWNLCEKQITSVHSTECVQKTCFLQSILVVYCFVWFQEKTYAIALYSENSTLKEEQWKKPFKNWFCSSLR